MTNRRRLAPLNGSSPDNEKRKHSGIDAKDKVIEDLRKLVAEQAAEIAEREHEGAELKLVLAKATKDSSTLPSVLHKWNERLDAHVHLHSVVPGGGPSLIIAGTGKKAVPPPQLPKDVLVSHAYSRPDCGADLELCLATTKKCSVGDN